MDLDRPPHFRSTSSSSTAAAATSELFICFTSRLSSSSSMKLTKSILSPGRAARDGGPATLSSSLSRRLRHNGSVKGGQASPFFTTRKRGCGFENPEPSSPKVTCIGQVRVKTKKKKKKANQQQNRSLSKRRSGEVSFRKMEQDGGQAPPDRNQRWVHLPVSICEALRAEFSCLFTCRSSCVSSSSSDDDKAGEKHSGCGAVFARWLVSVNDGKRREIELVVGDDGDDDDERSSRRHVFEDIEVKDDDTVEVKGEAAAAARVSICVPPKNALLLMRCRSDPMKMADLANRFSWAAATQFEENEDEFQLDEENVVVPAEEEEVEKNDVVLEPEGIDEEDDDRNNVVLERECNEGNVVVSGEQVEEEEDDRNNVVLEREGNEEEDDDKNDVVLERECNEEEEDDRNDVVLERVGNEEEKDDRNDVVLEREDNEEEKEEEEIRDEGEAKLEDLCHGEEELAVSNEEMIEENDVVLELQEEILGNEETLEEEEEEVESNMSSFEALLVQENAENYEDCPIQDKEEVEENPNCHLSPSTEPEEEEEDIESSIEAPQLLEEATMEHEKEASEESINGEEEEEGSRSSIIEKEKQRQKVLPECLLLMMCEPKLSMEVSKETWVCSTDFIRLLPRKPAKAAKAADQDPVKRRLSIDSKPKAEPPRSSCSLPVAAAAVSMATMLEQKLANAVAYEPFVLTRCKSEPMRTAAAKLMPESCFWKNAMRKMEPHRRGVGAAGVGF